MTRKINILITAGPTREYIDPVRYISNDSSGEMGLALADAAKNAGAKVTLIHGPITKVPPLSIRYLNVVSAQEMFAAVKKNYKKADIIILAAAVADWRPKRFAKSKIKKPPLPNPPPRGGREREGVTLKLIENPDILAWLGNHRLKKQTLVGFALETENLLKNSQNKLKNKKCDVIVGNLAKNIGKKDGSALILTKNGYKKHIKNCSKKTIAKAILTTICQKMQSC
jgi:phosphopantothenoylcysteine synthetase/decarboxylase